jgi:branched-subunit amino acid aminotransferase/4-amino-4-deoxychorismate lyase
VQDERLRAEVEGLAVKEQETLEELNSEEMQLKRRQSVKQAAEEKRRKAMREKEEAVKQKKVASMNKLTVIAHASPTMDDSDSDDDGVVAVSQDKWTRDDAKDKGRTFDFVHPPISQAEAYGKRMCQLFCALTTRTVSTMPNACNIQYLD